MIGVPNMLTLVIEFIAYEVTVIYLGQVSVDIQATQILLLNFFSLVIMVSFGYQQATCALIGQQIGANNVFLAKQIWYKLLFLFALSDVVIWCLLFWNRYKAVSIYTRDKKVETLMNDSIWITIVVIAEAIMKNSILGIIKALEQQKKALYLNLFIYIFLTLPLAYVFAFVVQGYDVLTDKDESTNNRGIGIWIAFVIGAGFQTVGYLSIIALTDWWKISEISRDRLKLNTKLLDDPDTANDEKNVENSCHFD